MQFLLLNIFGNFPFLNIFGSFPFLNIFGIFPVAQLVEHGVSNTKIMGSIPRESKSF